jgi:hypothetical protein
MLHGHVMSSQYLLNTLEFFAKQVTSILQRQDRPYNASGKEVRRLTVHAYARAQRDQTFDT